MATPNLITDIIGKLHYQNDPIVILAKNIRSLRYVTQKEDSRFRVVPVIKRIYKCSSSIADHTKIASNLGCNMQSFFFE